MRTTNVTTIPEPLRVFFKSCTSQDGKCLDLSNKAVTDDRIETILPYLNLHPEITTVDLADNYIGDAGAEIFAWHNKFVTEVNLSNNRIGPEGAMAVAEHNQIVTKINLSSNHIGPKGVGAFAYYNRVATEVNLTDNSIGDAGAEIFARYNKMVTKVNLAHNEIGPKGVEAFVNHNQFVTTLDLCGNSIGGEGVKALAEHNTVATVVYVSEDMMRSPKSIDALVASQTIAFLFTGITGVPSELCMMNPHKRFLAAQGGHGIVLLSEGECREDVLKEAANANQLSTPVLMKMQNGSYKLWGDKEGKNKWQGTELADFTFPNDWQCQKKVYVSPADSVIWNTLKQGHTQPINKPMSALPSLQQLSVFAIRNSSLAVLDPEENLLKFKIEAYEQRWVTALPKTKEEMATNVIYIHSPAIVDASAAKKNKPVPVKYCLCVLNDAKGESQRSEGEFLIPMSCLQSGSDAIKAYILDCIKLKESLPATVSQILHPVFLGKQSQVATRNNTTTTTSSSNNVDANNPAATSIRPQKS